MKMDWNSRRKAVHAIVFAALVAALLPGCGGTGGPKPSAIAKGSSASQVPPISVMMIQFAAEPMKKDSPVIKQLETLTNTKLDITWVPATTYDDKVSATIASGNLPELMLLRRNKESAMLNAQLSGMFWDLSPYLKNYKNLSQLSPVAVTNASLNGKLYGIPRERPIARYGLIFRKDWLDHLGLPVPRTVDDIYKTAKAFTLSDPDQDGKNDTFGMQEEKSIESLKQIALFLGAPNAWGLKDGRITPDFLYPEFKSALDLLRQMTDEHLINADFAIAKKYSYFNQEKAGMYFSVIGDAITHPDLLKANPNAVIDVTQTFDGPQGERVRATTGYDSLLVIPKSSVKNEARLKQILTFLDQMAEQPVQDLIDWGMEGTDYTMAGGKPKKIPNTPGAGDLNMFRWDLFGTSMKGTRTPLEDKFDQLYAQNKSLSVMDLSASLLSDTNTEKGNELKTAISDAETKYIMGELNDQGWHAAVDKWRKDGGDKIIDEFTASYNQSKK
ncbi:extracellular solute-binding protein [Paenibacillus cremeus]|nr:extracellular solute-binding protein [Paenibacillus cremeus]